MKRFAKLSFCTCFVVIASLASRDFAVAAEDAVRVQDLMNVRASGQATARWMRQPASYIVQVVIEQSKPQYSSQEKASTTGEQTRLLSPGEVQVSADMVQRKGNWNVPENAPADLFISYPSPHLGGIDPDFDWNRPLTVFVGRQSTPQQPDWARVSPKLSGDERIKDFRVEVWLLKRDGTQILPLDYSRTSGTSGRKEVEIRYVYPTAEGEQAVAVAIRVDDKFYIEKLQ